MYTYIALNSNKCLNMTDLELTPIINEIDRLLPQLVKFIGEFHGVINQYSLQVITDSAGNMEIDVPNSFKSEDVTKITTKIGILDRLINTHGASINDFFQKGLSVENKLKINDPNYNSVLLDKIAEFKLINASYKH